MGEGRKFPLKISQASTAPPCCCSPVYWLSPISVPFRLYSEKLLLGLQQDLTKQGNIDKVSVCEISDPRIMERRDLGLKQCSENCGQDQKSSVNTQANFPMKIERKLNLVSHGKAAFLINLVWSGNTPYIARLRYIGQLNFTNLCKKGWEGRSLSDCKKDKSTLGL